MDYSPPGSSDHGILQARILEWVAISFSRGIFLTQESNPGLLHYRQILYQLSYKGDPLSAPTLLQRAVSEISSFSKWTFYMFQSIPVKRIVVNAKTIWPKYSFKKPESSTDFYFTLYFIVVDFKARYLEMCGYSLLDFILIFQTVVGSCVLLSVFTVNHWKWSL